jgi:PilZ domain-containing protein
VEQHPDKTFIGRIERGFTFLGYWITKRGVTGIAPATWQAYFENGWHPPGLSPDHDCTSVPFNCPLSGLLSTYGNRSKNDKASPEKRRWRRFHFAVPVQITIEKPRHVTLADARGWRMNSGGTALYAETELSIGSEAEIEFTPPHFYSPVTLRGLIRNRAGDLYGVEFLANSAPEKEQLGLFRQALARWDAAAQQAQATK